MDKQKITTLILAGRRHADDFADQHSVSNKAFIKLKDSMLIEHVIEALQESDLPQPYLISISKNQEQIFKDKLQGYNFQLIVNEDDTSAMAGIIKAISTIQPGQDLLVTTADNPLLNKEILDNFLNFEREKEICDFNVGVVNGQIELVEAIPHVKRTWHKINKTLWLSGANLFFFHKPSRNGQKADTTADTLKKLESYRKNPLAFCATIAKVNLLFLFKYLLHISSLEECNRESSKAIGLSTNLKLIPFSQACIDIDKQADYELALQILDNPKSFFKPTNN